MEQIQLKREAQLLIAKICIEALLRAQKPNDDNQSSSQPLQNAMEKVP